MKKSVLITVLFFNAGVAMADDTASWAVWSGTSAAFTQNGSTVNVTYTGQLNSIDYNASYFNSVPTSFTSSEVTNTPGSNGAIHMTGGTPDVNTLHFSQAVINPLIAEDLARRRNGSSNHVSKARLQLPEQPLFRYREPGCRTLGRRLAHPKRKFRDRIGREWTATV